MCHWKSRHNSILLTFTSDYKNVFLNERDIAVYFQIEPFATSY
jgi:hypothetical protein